MFKTEEKTDLNQISLTGLRALVFISLLVSKPCSMDEIKQNLINLKIMDESQKDDILRIDLNTIKSMGCEISRPSPKTDFKYVLTKHPFSLKISKDEIFVLKKVYNQIKSTANIYTLLEYDELFRKIALYMCDEESKEDLLGISIFKHYDIDFIKNLMQDCKYNRELELVYKATTLSNETTKRIVAQKLIYKNEKFYIYGFDLGIKKSTVLNLKRIKSILKRGKNTQNIEIEETKVKFILKNAKPEWLENNEEIIETLETGFLVEGFYHNDFLATQRILSFGSKCTIVEPEDFKINLINKIKEMRKNYERK